MKTPHILTLFLTLLTPLFFSAGAARGATPSEKHKPLRILIVDGFSNHDWQQTTRLVRQIIEPTGLFSVEVSTTPPTSNAAGWDQWRPEFSAYDVVIQNCNSLRGRPTWPKAVEEALEQFVSGGGGLYVLHSGNNSFEHWPAYNQMIGLGWRAADFGTAITVKKDGTVKRIPPGKGEATGHGKRFDALITRLGEHSIHQGLPRQWLAADLEVYRYARGPAENLTVLSYALEPKSQLNFPIEWVVQYGQGRVFNSTYGHIMHKDPNPPGARCVAFQTLLIRALQWVGGEEVSWPVPDDFPDGNKIRLR